MANDYLFKIDTASMKESLEVCVPMLDEVLVGFWTLPAAPSQGAGTDMQMSIAWGRATLASYISR